jgi:hypothetical protein
LTGSRTVAGVLAVALTALGSELAAADTELLNEPPVASVVKTEAAHRDLIQPGAPVCVPPVPWEENPCGTAGFVLRDKSGGLYITVAAHGYGLSPTADHRAYTEEGTPFARGGLTDGFGTMVVDDDTETDAGHGADVALIRIDRDKYGSVEPSVRYWTGPTGLLGVDDGDVGDIVYNYAHANDPQAQAGFLVLRTANNFNTTMQRRESPGASGSPYLYASDGAALGLNGNCLCGTGTFGYPTLEYVLTRLRTVYGYDLKLVEAPYDPPADPEPAL